MQSMGRVIWMCAIFCLITLPLVARSDAVTDQPAATGASEEFAEARLLGPPPHEEQRSEEALKQYQQQFEQQRREFEQQREEFEQQRQELERWQHDARRSDEDARRFSDTAAYKPCGQFDRARHVFNRQAIETQIEAVESERHHLELELRELEKTIQQHDVGRERTELRTQAEKVRQTLEMREQQLEYLHQQLEMLEHEHGMEVEERELGMMRERLEYVSGWEETVFDPARAVVLATQNLIELSEEEPEEVLEVLEELVEEVPGIARNVVRFALKDMYLRLGDEPGAARQMVLVIRENAELMARHPQ